MVKQVKYNQYLDEFLTQEDDTVEQSYKPKARHTDIDERDRLRRLKRKQKRAYDTVKHDLSKQRIG